MRQSSRLFKTRSVIAGSFVRNIMRLSCSHPTNNTPSPFLEVNAALRKRSTSPTILRKKDSGQPTTKGTPEDRLFETNSTRIFTDGKEIIFFFVRGVFNGDGVDKLSLAGPPPYFSSVWHFGRQRFQSLFQLISKSRMFPTHN